MEYLLLLNDPYVVPMLCLILLTAAMWVTSDDHLTFITNPTSKQPDGGEIFTHNERSPQAVLAARQALPVVRLDLPGCRLQRLPITMRKLRAGQELRVVMLGDSIINDTARSAWHELVEQHYPGSRIHRVVSVRGNTGMWWYKLENRVDRYVLQHKPDLVILGGISHRHEVESMREVIRQIRQRSDVDLFLMSGPFGKGVDPLSGPDWRQRLHDGKDERYVAELSALADEVGAEFLDMQRYWGEYLRRIGRPVTDFMRDEVHANALGEAVLGRILEQYFLPPNT